MKALDFIKQLQTQGRYSFKIQEAEKAFGLSKVATLNALQRLKQNKYIVSPAKGFYLIIPPEYQSLGCLPAEMFIPKLMQHFAQSYYVGFLSAVQYYGAAHQKPQRFQVVVLKNRRPIKCGLVYIEFIANEKVSRMPTKEFNTAAGTILLATPEALAADLVTSPQHAAGINNVATILMELRESISPKNLLKLTKIYPESFWIQRLGYMLDRFGAKQLASVLYKALSGRKLHWAKLMPQTSYVALERDSKWKIIVNTEIEPD